MQIDENYSCLKKLVAIVALLGIMLQTFSQVVVLADYYVHKDYIAKNLCENRDKPMMHCDGKCCLKKKLAKQGKEQAPSPTNNKSEQVVTLFFTDSRYEIPPVTILSEACHFFNRNDLRTCAFHGSVFHPPTV